MPTAITQPGTDPRQCDLFGPVSPATGDPLIFQKESTTFSRQPYFETVPTAMPAPSKSRKSKRPGSDAPVHEAPAAAIAPQPNPASEKQAQGKRRNKKVRPSAVWPDPVNHRFDLYDYFEHRYAEQPEEALDEKPELDNVAVTDGFEVGLAKLMFQRFKYDIGFSEQGQSSQSELFGATTRQSDGSGVRSIDKINAIVWLYDFHPQEVQVSFDWVCDTLCLDGEMIRRIVARHERDSIRQAIELLAPLDLKHAQVCEDKVSDYVNVSGWKVY